MSEPKRMTVTWKGLCGGDKDKTEWVSLEEYNKLKADLDYVRKMRTQETLDLQEMADLNNAYRAEIARLREAGDKLAGGRTHTFTIHGLLIPDPDVVAWNAAKEGKPSV